MTTFAEHLRPQFPGLAEIRGGKPLAYLDSAATAQKPLAVIERMDRFLREEYGTVHRGLYHRSVGSTKAYEDARTTVARFINAPRDSIVFTSGTTDSVNLVAWSWGRSHLKPGDQVLVTGMEHHAMIVPWQIAAAIHGAELIACPILDDGSLDRKAFKRLLATGRVKLVGLTWVANSLGTINPVRELTAEAHAAGARVLIDAAQAVPHRPIDVTAIDCDFLVFSGHKMYGPTGIGVLYGKAEALAAMPPWRGGGEMIEKVSFAGTTFAKPPARFEAGTPPITEAIGLAAACDWLASVGWNAIEAAERELFSYAESRLAEVPGLRRFGTAAERCTVLAFTLPNCHAADIAAILDQEHIAIRAGHHCAQPVMDRFAVPATARASLGVYSTTSEIDRLIDGLHLCRKLFG